VLQVSGTDGRRGQRALFASAGCSALTAGRHAPGEDVMEQSAEAPRWVRRDLLSCYRSQRSEQKGANRQLVELRRLFE